MEKSKEIFKVYLKGEKSESLQSASGIPIKEKYGPDDLVSFDYQRNLGEPGEYPFTRGIYPNMYKGRMWTRRFQVGFGIPEDVRERLKFLYKEGQTGFTLTIDLPTSYGFDSDDPIAEGEVGVTGVTISTLEDLETIFTDFSPNEVSCSFSVRPPISAVMLAMIVALAEKRGIELTQILGTIQNDPIFQMSGGPFQTTIQFFPFDGIIRLCVDVIEYCSRNLPRLNWMVANTYNVRDTGVNAVEEAAFSFALAFDVFRKVIDRGLNIDDFAPRASFLNAAGMDFFEEIAKFRAMRRMWARLLKENFGAKDPRSLRLRVAVQNSGSSYTTQQPLNNIIRGTCSMLSAVFSGLQSLQVASYDEGLCLPTEESSRISLRISQIIGYETGVTATVDPLGGSYFLEALTNQIEEEISKLLSKIEELGGMLEATKIGWTEQRILEARVKNQRRIESDEKTIVGVNKFTIDEAPKIKLHRIKTQEWEKQRHKYLRKYREERDATQVEKNLRKVSEGMLGTENMIPIITEALNAKATLGEICNAMRSALGFNLST